MLTLDFTHDPQRRSWIATANTDDADFPLQNLPFGVFQRPGGHARIGVAIGDQIVDLFECVERQLLPAGFGEVLTVNELNSLMRLARPKRVALRQAISNLLAADGDIEPGRVPLIAQSDASMMLPCTIGDYTDFYASVYHATNVGLMFRPDNPLLPNYKHIPIGYHGRSSSIVVSGTDVRRPVGQKGPESDQGLPTRGPSALLDYEFEVGFFVGDGNPLGTTIGIESAEDHIFGMVLVNDWSARDIQKWEYQPLGPFLAKSFATTISPWVVTLEALAPFRCGQFVRGDADPQPLEYLVSDMDRRHGGIDIQLQAMLSSARMREQSLSPITLSCTSFRNMYWTIAQMLTHHSSNGCNMRPGDLLASGTVSGPGRDERGCLLELTWNGDAQNPRSGTDRTPIILPTGEERKFLADGDEVTLTAFCENGTHRRIGFGTCRGKIEPACFSGR
jgi:fumarylacetoacetase